MKSVYGYTSMEDQWKTRTFLVDSIDQGIHLLDTNNMFMYRLQY